MVSPIPLVPGMSPENMAQAINDTHRQLEAENRTKVILDKNGKKQITIGANGDEYGIYIGENITMRDGVISLKDENGDERIRIGLLPNGKQGMVVTKPGYSVDEAIT